MALLKLREEIENNIALKEENLLIRGAGIHTMEKVACYERYLFWVLSSLTLQAGDGLGPLEGRVATVCGTIHDLLRGEERREDNRDG